MQRLLVPAFVALAGGLATGGRAEAAGFERTVPFALDQWIGIELKEGPVTIHRVRVERKGGLKGFKSTVSRPGNSQFLQDVQIQIEYSNTSTADWQVRGRIVWLDAADKTIDGYEGTEDLDEEESHDVATMLFSTLRYGLDQARKLHIALEVVPD
jgi:hypothetical protein